MAWKARLGRKHMRIHDTNTAGLGTSGPSRAQSTEAAGAEGLRQSGRDAATGESDRVNLSVLAERLRSQEPESAQHAAHLEQLSAAFRAGTYTPDPGRVSDKLIDEALVSSNEDGPAATLAG